MPTLMFFGFDNQDKNVELILQRTKNILALSTY